MRAEFVRKGERRALLGKSNKWFYDVLKGFKSAGVRRAENFLPEREVFG